MSWPRSLSPHAEPPKRMERSSGQAWCGFLAELPLRSRSFTAIPLVLARFLRLKSIDRPTSPKRAQRRLPTTYAGVVVPVTTPRQPQKGWRPMRAAHSTATTSTPLASQTRHASTVSTIDLETIPQLSKSLLQDSHAHKQSAVPSRSVRARSTARTRSRPRKAADDLSEQKHPNRSIRRCGLFGRCKVTPVTGKRESPLPSQSPTQSGQKENSRQEARQPARKGKDVRRSKSIWRPVPFGELVHRLAYNDDTAASKLAVFQGASDEHILIRYVRSKQRRKTANWPRPEGLR
jgi:hypothetical protein